MDYKTYSQANNGCKMYYNVGKFFAKKNDNNGWINSGLFYQAASTCVKMDIIGFGDNPIVGKWQVTWYVKFRGFKGS